MSVVTQYVLLILNNCKLLNSKKQQHKHPKCLIATVSWLFFGQNIRILHLGKEIPELLEIVMYKLLPAKWKKIRDQS